MRRWGEGSQEETGTTPGLRRWPGAGDTLCDGHVTFVTLLRGLRVMTNKACVAIITSHEALRRLSEPRTGHNVKCAWLPDLKVNTRTGESRAPNKYYVVHIALIYYPHGMLLGSLNSCKIEYSFYCLIAVVPNTPHLFRL